MPRSDVSARRTSGDAILGSGHAGGRLDAVTSLDTLKVPLQLEHVVGAVRLLAGRTHGWPGRAAEQRALARGLVSPLGEHQHVTSSSLCDIALARDLRVPV